MKTPHNPDRRKKVPLSGDELADIEEQFDECDADGDQRIDFMEFSQLLDNLGADIPAAQRRSRFDAIDSDHNGAIDRREFTEWWRTGSLIP
jgi:Ca2+-binding EF-hand superfamily protein